MTNRPDISRVKCPVSVVILTLNEELNLPGALESLEGFCEDVVVFDSFSSDATCQIASDWGARVIQRRFDNYAGQRNAALHEVEYSNAWVFMLDADERIPFEMWQELLSVVAKLPAEVALVRVRRRDYFMGQWLRRSSGYPTWFGRLVRPAAVRVEREINEEYTTSGEIRQLESHLTHLPFNRGIYHWVARHNDYSTAEAALLVGARAGVEWAHLFSRDPVLRRKAQKAFAFRLPFRPLVVFLYLFVLRGGFLDGAAGFRFCTMRMLYEVLIDLKVSEARHS